jgi:hypothetical protein
MLRIILVLFFVSCWSCAEPASVTPPSQDVAVDGTFRTVDVPSVPNDSGPMPSTAPTWHGGVQALIETRCGGCHVADGIAPFPLETYEEAVTFAAASAASVSAGRMPPWPPAEDCGEFMDARRMTDDEVTMLVAWVAGGTLLGDPVTAVTPPPETRLTEPADVLMDAGADYTPDMNLSDDYRCLVLDHEFTEETLVHAVDIYPGSPPVHHVLVYVVEAEDVAELEALDAADPALGYQCFGGPVVGGSNMLSGWVPGGQPVLAPDDSAFVIEAGSRIVMQMHYSLVGYGSDKPAPPDRTTMGLWLLDKGDMPSFELQYAAFANTGIDIAADDPESIHEKVFELKGSPTIVGVAPHMHLLGRAISVSIVLPSEAPVCLIEIPDWDFAWQQIYLFPPDAFLTLSPGSELNLTCIHDNSASNQPVLNGVQRSPTDVGWGEGTYDEMCLTYLLFQRPYIAPGVMPCAGFSACLLAAADGDGAAVYACLFEESTCTECLKDGIGVCGQAFCPDAWQALTACVGGCQNGSEGGCLAWDGPCHETLESFTLCIEPSLRAGSCDDALQEACVEAFER